MKILIKNAYIKTIIDGDIENGFIAFDGSKITHVSKDEPNNIKDYKVIDAQGAEVTPGIVDPHCHVGAWEEGIGWEGSDGNEMTNPITPNVRIIDAIYYQDEAFKNAAKAGITTVCTGPGSGNVIGGQFAIIKTFAKSLNEAVVQETSSMKMALGENPKRVYGSGQKVMPATRMGTAAIMREWLSKAKEYNEKMKNSDKDKRPGFDAKLDALSKVFNGMKVKIHAHRSDDIETAIRIADEFKLDMTVEHATESHLIADYVKEKKYPMIIGPTLGNKSKYELRNKSFDVAKVLEEKGVEFAIMTDAPVISIENTMLQSAMYVKAGASKDAVLKAMTYNAAKLNGIEKRVGALKVGMDADIVVWKNNMWDLYNDPKHVFVNGKEVE